MQDKPGTSQESFKPPPTKEYEVVAETGIFKNGKLYKKGEKILLIEKAAANFLASRDVVSCHPERSEGTI